MKKIEDLFKVELLEDGNYCITMITDSAVGYSVERFSLDGIGLLIKKEIERILKNEYENFIQDRPYYCDYCDDYSVNYYNYLNRIEKEENDKRVIEQYYENYYQLFEGIRNRVYSLINYETEDMSSFDYEYLDWLYEDENRLYEMQENERLENDKRVIEQYDENYLEHKISDFSKAKLPI